MVEPVTAVTTATAFFAKLLPGAVVRIAGDAIGKALDKSKLERAGKDARDWLERQGEAKKYWAVLEGLKPEAWESFRQAVDHFAEDLRGHYLQNEIRTIFSHLSLYSQTPVDDETAARLADLFYEAILRAFLASGVNRVAFLAERLLADLDVSRLQAAIKESSRPLDYLVDYTILLRRPYWPLPFGRRGVAELLIANYGIAPFWGRRAEIDDLLAWCNGGDNLRIRVYTAPGGEGKTRLFAELCAEVEKRSPEWLCGFLRVGQMAGHEAALARLLDLGRPLLLGVDYAAAKTKELLTLAPYLQAARGKVRLVLLERPGGTWWDDLCCQGVEAENFFSKGVQKSLEPLGANEGERQEIFKKAQEQFARFSPKDAKPTTPPDLRHDDYKNVLFIHVAALLSAHGDRAMSADDSLKRLLKHEEAWWLNNARQFSLPEKAPTLRKAAALGTLVGGVKKKSEALPLLKKIEALAHRNVEDLSNLCRALGGSPDGDREFLPALRPDRLGEALVEKVFAEGQTVRDELINAAFDEEKLAGAANALVVLSRIAGRKADCGTWIDRAVELLPKATGVAVLAIHTAVEFDVADRVAAAFEETKPMAAARMIHDLLPVESVNLRHFSAVITELALELARRKSPRDEECLTEIAGFANNLSNRYSNLGRRDEALAAAREAVDVYRDLAARNRDVFCPDLAMSLNNLGTTYAYLGWREEALAAAREAADFYRELAAKNPDSFRPYLGASLSNLGSIYSGVGRYDEALAAAREGVEIRRELAAEKPDAFRPALAMSLNNLGRRYSELGRRQEALAAAREAVKVWRELAVKNPDAFRPYLGGSLNNLGTMYSELGHRGEALAAAREAADVYRELAGKNPDAFRPDLAGSLNNLGVMYSNLGRREEALAAVREAVDIQRELAAKKPEAFRPALAESLNNLGSICSDLGRREEALAAAREAVKIRRELAAQNPEAFRPALAESLNNLGSICSGLGRREEALAAAHEAVDVYRELAGKNPDAFRPDLAASLNNLGNSYSALGRREEALAAVREAVESLRPHFLQIPRAFGQWMTSIIQNYLQYCETCGVEPDGELLGPIVAKLAETVNSEQ
jgi:tetratricopeptide (TPR) repeat protein